MNADLEQQLNEMGPEYRAVVARLRAGGEAQPDLMIIGGRRGPTFVWLSWNARLLVAASLAVLLGLVAFLQISRTSQTCQTSDSRAPREYTMSVDEMIATQNPDGSWQNDFLTRRNAEALRRSSAPLAQVAYKKAVRNLRVRGVL